MSSINIGQPITITKKRQVRPNRRSRRRKYLEFLKNNDESNDGTNNLSNSDNESVVDDRFNIDQEKIDHLNARLDISNDELIKKSNQIDKMKNGRYTNLNKEWIDLQTKKKSIQNIIDENRQKMRKNNKYLKSYYVLNEIKMLQTKKFMLQKIVMDRAIKKADIMDEPEPTKLISEYSNSATDSLDQDIYNKFYKWMDESKQLEIDIDNNCDNIDDLTSKENPLKINFRQVKNDLNILKKQRDELSDKINLIKQMILVETWKPRYLAYADDHYIQYKDCGDAKFWFHNDFNLAEIKHNFDDDDDARLFIACNQYYNEYLLLNAPYQDKIEYDDLTFDGYDGQEYYSGTGHFFSTNCYNECPGWFYNEGRCACGAKMILDLDYCKDEFADLKYFNLDSRNPLGSPQKF
jgi:hypothetical protein